MHTRKFTVYGTTNPIPISPVTLYSKPPQTQHVVESCRTYRSRSDYVYSSSSKLSGDCDGHVITASLGGPWKFEAHTSAELDTEKVLLAMGGQCGCCCTVAIARSGFHVANDYALYGFVRPEGWGPCALNLLPFSELLHSEFFALSTGFRYLNRFKKHSKYKGSDNNTLSLASVLNTSDLSALDAPAHRVTFIEAVVTAIRKELKARGVGAIINKMWQRLYSWQMGSCHFKRVRFARGGYRVSCDIVNYGSGSGYGTTAGPSDYYRRASFNWHVPMSGQMTPQLYPVTQRLLEEEIERYCAAAKLRNVGCANTPLKVIQPRLSGLASAQSWGSSAERSVDLLGAWIDSTTGVMDISYIVDCLQAAKLQGIMAKVYGPEIVANTIREEHLAKFSKYFSKRELGLQLQVAPAMEGADAQYVPTLATRKRGHKHKGYNITFSINGTFSLGDGTNPSNRQRMHTFLSKILSSYDVVKKLN